MKLTFVVICAALGCSSRPPVDKEEPSCGVTVQVMSVAGSAVQLRFSNVSDQKVEVGASTDASFVDATGAVMHAQMGGGGEHWFMPFELPAQSHSDVTVNLGQGGDPKRLDRIEVPDSGPDRIPRCTIRATRLSVR